MGRPQHPLPPELGAVFSARQALDAGVRSNRLGGQDVTRLARGMYRRNTDDRRPQGHPDAIWRELQRAQATALAPQLAAGQFFAGVTAAALWELPVPRPLLPGSRTVPDDRLTIGTLRSTRTCRRTEHRTVSIADSLATVVERHGMPVTDPATTWAMVAPILRFEDAVALGDALLYDSRIPGTTRSRYPRLATLDELEAASSLPYRRRSAELLELLPLLSSHSASPPESHLRLRLLEWGLPEPMLDHDIRAPNGTLLGCSEFAWPKFRVAGEYEGGHHLTEASQWNRDIEKHHYYRVHGWETVRATAHLLYVEPIELRRRFVDALRTQGWTG